MAERKFTGHVGRTVFDTDFQYEDTVRHPKDAPNVLYIVLDDVGFANIGCYGSNINTSNIDRLAHEGLRYNNFHTTAICSATRASLLTGANHHAAGVGSVVEMANGCNNSLGHLNPSYATLAEILREYDYSTFHAGKWHLSQNLTPSGPFDYWPLGKGFERFYGFLDCETDQFHPQLVQDNTFIDPPKTSKEGYHFSEDITDHAIEFLYNQKNSFPDKPFFLYLAYGAAHAPHHAPKEYIDRYKGKFDEGWDVMREQWFAKQKEIGLIPQDAELTDRAPHVEAWDSLSDDKKRLYARYMEAFAGVMEYTDHQIGRVIDYLESIDQLDNTIIVFLSDNGASAEGGKEGRIVRHAGSDITDGADEAAFAIEYIDEIGGEYTFNHYPTGWANASNTPFQWYKVFSHEGGIKDPLIIRYPKLIRDAGGVRGQYHHVSDITPTVLDIIGIDKPAFIKGVPQKPFTGTSLKYTLTEPDAKDRKRVQYYETCGNRGIYKAGWKAVVNHTFSETYADDTWELYHVAEDYSEKYDVAAQYPEKLRELQEEFFLEAGRNDVFPLVPGFFHGSPDQLYKSTVLRDIPEAEREYKNVFLPYILPLNTGLSFDWTSHYVEAVINRKEGDEGVLFSVGDRFGGFTFYIKDNKLKYVSNSNRKAWYTAESDIEVPVGESVVRYDFDYTGKYKADVTIYIDNVPVGKTHIDRIYHGKRGVAVLRANPYTEVSPEYEAPFEFNGEIRRLKIHTYEFKASDKEQLDRILNQD